jgi:uncharacterized protein YndB with AHSA1/START domain
VTDASGPDVPGPPLVVRRTLSAPPERVFAAWLEPATLARWLSPFADAEATVDSRVGGAFRVVMRGSGREIEHTGEYREIDPPRRLVFTWSSPYTGSTPSLVTVELRAVPPGDRTELTLTHRRLPAGEVENHRAGWGAILGHLAAHLRRGSRARRSNASRPGSRARADARGARGADGERPDARSRVGRLARRLRQLTVDLHRERADRLGRRSLRAAVPARAP